MRNAAAATACRGYGEGTCSFQRFQGAPVIMQVGAQIGGLRAAYRGAHGEGHVIVVAHGLRLHQTSHPRHCGLGLYRVTTTALLTVTGLSLGRPVHLTRASQAASNAPEGACNHITEQL